MLMDLYIKGAAFISAAGYSGEDELFTTPPAYDTDALLCKEPDYTQYVTPMQLRRMSKAVRMGIAASKICLQNSGVEKPDALSVGTAMGCLYDTEQFLAKMVAQDEQMLTPTSFIQSTHNTVAGQIALLTGCYGHNLTYVHKGHSFEHAIINTQLYLNDHPTENMLAGGIDELTPNSKKLMQRAGVYSTANRTADDIITNTQEGSLAGEGASFMLVSKQEDKALLHIKGLNIFKTDDEREAIEKINTFLAEQGLAVDNIDLVLLGVNGDKRNAAFYNMLRNDTFKNNDQATFKQLSGEYATASAFAISMLLHCAQQNNYDVLLGKQSTTAKTVKRIVMVNNYKGYYSCWDVEVV